MPYERIQRPVPAEMVEVGGGGSPTSLLDSAWIAIQVPARSRAWPDSRRARPRVCRTRAVRVGGGIRIEVL